MSNVVFVLSLCLYKWRRVRVGRKKGVRWEGETVFVPLLSQRPWPRLEMLRLFKKVPAVRAWNLAKDHHICSSQKNITSLMKIVLEILMMWWSYFFWCNHSLTRRSMQKTMAHHRGEGFGKTTTRSSNIEIFEVHFGAGLPDYNQFWDGLEMPDVFVDVVEKSPCHNYLNPTQSGGKKHLKIPNGPTLRYYAISIIF